MTETEIKTLRPKETDYMGGCGSGLWLRVRVSVLLRIENCPLFEGYARGHRARVIVTR